MPWPLPHAVQCCGDHNDTDSEALGRRKAGSKCPGPCPTWYTARDGSVRIDSKEGKQFERSSFHWSAQRR